MPVRMFSHPGDPHPSESELDEEENDEEEDAEPFEGEGVHRKKSVAKVPSASAYRTARLVGS